MPFFITCRKGLLTTAVCPGVAASRQEAFQQALDRVVQQLVSLRNYFERYCCRQASMIL